MLGRWWKWVRESWLGFLVLVSAALAAAIVVTLILPGYSSPLSRITTSKFGYPAVYRRINKPFPVPVARLTRRQLSQTALGEGLMRSEPTVVPVIPMGRIEKVLVTEGDKVSKGQLIATVDATKAKIKVEAAKAAVQTAKSELERVKIGSAYVLSQERPERDMIRLEAAEQEQEIRRELIAIQEKLADQKAMSRTELLTQRIAQIELQARLNEAKFNLEMSSKGVLESQQIAESAIREAELALEHRLVELADHEVRAIADGIIERCLVREGEYNQDPGKPGFLIATGAWFEANFDQGAYSRVSRGQEATVRLEAYPGRFFAGTVERVDPFVKYDLGGPESTRPIRPLGTGAPEWPATFAVRVRLGPDERDVLPGMTGFCLVRSSSDVPCLPREAVSAVTSGKGIVNVVNGERFEPREVTLGIVDGDWIEIRDGLTDDDVVIRDGYQVLEPGDRIEIVATPAAAAEGG